MPLSRRELLALASGGAAASGLLPHSGGRASRSRIEAIAFDAFPIFDPRPIQRLAETLFPGKGAELGDAWRTRLFEYQWLRGLSDRYADFWQTAEEALVFAARLKQLELTAEKRGRLMRSYLELGAWPDVPAALRSLREAGLRLAFLSNMTPKMLAAGIENAGLTGLFEHVLSTDEVRLPKPAPRAYQLALDAFGLEREAVLFAAFAGWDVAGAKWFGYPTFWVNRLGLPVEELGVLPDAAGRDLTDLASYVMDSR